MRLIDADALIDRIKNPYEQAQVARWVNEQPTIESEKRTEKRTETHACDLIDREAAIRAVNTALFPKINTAKDAEKALRDLPSAQPDNQVNLCDSCKYTYPDCPSQNDDVIFGNGNGDDNICACAKYAPSAQLEIIRCKDCKWFGDIGCAISIVDDTDKPSEEDYCSFAERRTDE